MIFKTTDLIASFFKSKGVNSVFGVTGGAAVHLFDSYKKKKFNIIFTHHEQSAAFAVCSYFKENKKMARVVPIPLPVWQQHGKTLYLVCL